MRTDAVHVERWGSGTARDVQRLGRTRRVESGDRTGKSSVKCWPAGSVASWMRRRGEGLVGNAIDVLAGGGVGRERRRR